MTNTVSADGLFAAAKAAASAGGSVTMSPQDAALLADRLNAGERVAATLRRYHLDRLEELGLERAVPCKGSCHVCVTLLEWRNTLALGQPALVQTVEIESNSEDTDDISETAEPITDYDVDPY